METNGVLAGGGRLGVFGLGVIGGLGMKGVIKEIRCGLIPDMYFGGVEFSEPSFFDSLSSSLSLVGDAVGVNVSEDSFS